MNTFSNLSTQTAVPWLTVPGDWRRPKAKERHKIYWDAERSFGQILPRPQPEEVASFYELDEYYTHEASNSLQSEERQLS